MEMSLHDFVRGCCAYIQNQQAQRSPDNTLVELLSEGVRLAREHDKLFREMLIRDGVIGPTTGADVAR